MTTAPSKTRARKPSATPRKKTAATAVKTADAPLSASTEAEQVLAIILKTLDDNKAEDIAHVSLAGKSPLADYLVIATGRSSRHVTALSNLIDDALAKEKFGCRLEGRENGDWVLVDAGEVIVHLFRPEVRSFYNLEKLWDVTLPPAPAKE